jgi:hypothetical protein
MALLVSGRSVVLGACACAANNLSDFLDALPNDLIYP